MKVLANEFLSVCGSSARSLGRAVRGSRFACLAVMFFVGLGVLLAGGGGGVSLPAFLGYNC